MSEIDDIKSRIDIVDFIGKKVVLKKAGKNFKGLCPFHGEKTPSFMVSPDRQSWHCFGCGKGGSVFDFVMEYDRIDFREALEELADMTGVVLSKASVSKDTIRDTLLDIHRVAGDYYHYLLTAHAVGEKAREYLQNRGISEKLIKTFHLGYSANNWEGLTSYLLKKGYTRQQLEQSGLLIASPKGGYDRFRGRIMFPLRDQRGRTIGFSGRVLLSDVKEAKYINSPETPIYIKGNTLFALDVTKSAIQKANEVILMEGEFDVLSSYQAGISNVVAIKGTALTEAHVHLLKRYTKKIIFALDSDVAGDNAARRGIDIAHSYGMELYVARMPLGKDPDDAARTAPHLLKEAIANALSLYDYYIASAQEKYDLTQAYGKKSFSEEVFPLIAEIENQVIQSHYIKKLSQMFDTPESAIVSTMHALKRKQSVQKEAPVEAQQPAVQQEKQEILLLALFVQGYELIPNSFKFDVSMFQTPAIRYVFEHLLSNASLSLSESIRLLPQEYAHLIDQALLWDLSGVIEDSKVFSHMLFQTRDDITKKYLKETLRLLSKKLEDGGESEDIQSEIQHISTQLRALEKKDKV